MDGTHGWINRGESIESRERERERESISRFALPSMHHNISQQLTSPIKISYLGNFCYRLVQYYVNSPFEDDKTM
jgi:hypothetical protein